MLFRSRIVATVAAVFFFCGCGKKAGPSQETMQNSLAPNTTEPQPPAPAEPALQEPPAGKFKGGATLALALEKLVIHGKPYTVRCSGVEEESKGKGKRAAGMVGGGAAGGALIGGPAGGGKGAAIGAAAGTGTGTAGAAFTGNDRNISLPGETAIKFKLTESITVQQQATETSRN